MYIINEETQYDCEFSVTMYDYFKDGKKIKLHKHDENYYKVYGNLVDKFNMIITSTKIYPRLLNFIRSDSNIMIIKKEENKNFFEI